MQKYRETIITKVDHYKGSFRLCDWGSQKEREGDREGKLSLLSAFLENLPSLFPEYY